MRKTPIERLTERLNALGFDVLYIQPVSGYWKRQDVYRWTGYAVKGGSTVSIGSQCTVTECARGVTVERDFYGHGYEAFAIGRKQT